MRARQLVSVLVAIALLAVCLIPGIKVWAAACATNQDLQSCSSSYGVSESYFGPGGQLNGTSTNYSADSTAGDPAAGKTGSTNYQATAGGQNNRNVSLAFSVNNTGTDLGYLSTSTPKTTTATFTVQSYLSNGYSVVTASNPPASAGAGTHSFPSSVSTFGSTPGTEQFGINLATNTSPNIAGSSGPVQQPDSTFGFGAVAAGYGTANQFKYNKGDTVASASKSSGTTVYTVSYLFNISNATPSGLYTFRHVLVATANF